MDWFTQPFVGGYLKKIKRKLRNQMPEEIFEIGKAWVAIFVMFAIAINGFSFSDKFLFSLFAASLTAGIGFLAHELAHRTVARRFGTKARFRAFNMMLVIGILLSISGLILAAPGAVVIYGRPNRKENGMISAAGIGASLLVAAIFLAIYAAFQGNNVRAISSYGIYVNSWMALFNLIPFGIFDGKKVYDWSKAAYFSLAGFGIALWVASFII